MIKNKLSLCIFCIFLTSTVFASIPNQSELYELGKKYMRVHHDDEKFTALSITVYQSKDNETHSAYIGTRGKQNSAPIDRTCLFQTGSITKSFIAALLLKLQDDPRYHFNINDSIDKYFPAYKKWHNVTVKNLLQMTSGIPDYLDDPATLNKYKNNPYRNYAPEVWINAMLQKSLQFKPGTQFKYSNTNYVLLGVLIEKITGHSLQSELTEKIIKPLGLTYTYYIPTHPKSVLMPSVVHGYQVQNSIVSFIPLGTDITHYNVSYLQAAGCMYGTTEDISKWIAALFTPGKVLSGKQLQELMSFISEKNARHVAILSSNDPYAYGFGISAEYDKKLDTIFYLYEGITLGHRFLYLYSPKEKIIITIAANSNVIKKKNSLLALAKLIYVQSLSKQTS